MGVMEIHLKLGTLLKKVYQTKNYNSIGVNDKIEVLIQGKWKIIKIWQLYDEIPVLYFGEYL
jgi:hypothetical protein